MPRNQSTEKAYTMLLSYWAKFYPIDASHAQWLRLHAVAQLHPRGDILCSQTHQLLNVYFVSGGMLGRQVHNPETGKRQLLAVALPNRALFTTSHVFSATPTTGEIVTLRPSMVVRIPYKYLKQAENDLAIKTLTNALVSKKKSIADKLRLLFFVDQPIERYAAFCEKLPELKRVLSQEEQADLLNIGRRTVQRGINSS